MDGAKRAKGSAEKGQAREVTDGIWDKAMDHLGPINHREDFGFHSGGSESHWAMIWLLSEQGYLATNRLGCGAGAGWRRPEGARGR